MNNNAKILEPYKKKIKELEEKIKAMRIEYEKKSIVSGVKVKPPVKGGSAIIAPASSSSPSSSTTTTTTTSSSSSSWYDWVRGSTASGVGGDDEFVRRTEVIMEETLKKNIELKDERETLQFELMALREENTLLKKRLMTSE